jgi:hypothetical protein
MMSETIPEDIRAIAHAAFVLALGKPSHEERVATIAKAINAQRLDATERAAKIAEEFFSDPHHGGRDIAAAIRSQP